MKKGKEVRKRKTRHERVKGAVSVFLVIILVPVLLLTSLFVDTSRVKLSRDVAESASDLALNSLMTNYDADLNEWYGMVASCQNIDDYYALSAQYFLRMLSSQDLSTDEVMLLSDYYAAATQNGAIYNQLNAFLGDLDDPVDNATDLLKVDPQTPDDQIIKAVDNGTLGNATMVRNQVVEFMKYRGPIAITETILARFGLEAESGGLSNTQEANVNEPLVESKEKFYKTEGEFISKCYHTYKAIRKYSDISPKVDDLKADLDKLGNYKDDYKYYHENTIRYLYDTNTLMKNYIPASTSDVGTLKSGSYSLASCGDTYTNKDGDVYQISKSTLESQIDNLKNAIVDFENEMNNINGNSDVINVGNDPHDTTTSDKTNTIRWWKKADGVRSSNFGSIQSLGDEMMKRYAISKTGWEDATPMDENATDYKDNVNNAEDAEENPGERWTIGETKYTYTELWSKAEGLYGQYLDGSLDTGTAYGKLASELKSVSSDYAGDIDEGKWKRNIDGTDRTVSEGMAYISGQVNSKVSTLNDLITKISVPINGDGDKVVKITELATLAGQYHDDCNAWSTQANADDNSMHLSDQSELNNRTENDLINEVTSENCTALSNRLSNIKTILESVKGKYDNTKYNGTSIGSISTKDQFTTAMGSLSIPEKNGELDSYIETKFTEFYQPDSVSYPDHIDDADYNTYLNVTDSSVGEDIIPHLYYYMHQKFKNIDSEADSAIDKAESEQDAAQSAADQKESEAKEGEDNTPSSRFGLDTLSGDKDINDGSKKFNGATAIEGIIEFVTMLCDGDFDSLARNYRDAILTTAYIRENLTFSTYEKEGKYNLLEDKSGMNFLNCNNTPNKYYKDPDMLGDSSAADPSTNKGKWVSTDLTDTYNKTMTNHMKSADNNYVFNGEMEYILYGKGNKSNMNSAIGQIFTIRYALNLVSGFALFWSPTKTTTGAVINGIAEIIQDATLGIIPAPVTKVILIPILTVFETAIDMAKLKAGFPVKLYKAEEGDWVISLSGGSSLGDAMSEMGEQDGEGSTVVDEGLFYSDYITLFTLIGLSESSTAKAMYERLAEVIECNMDLVINGHDASKVSSSGGYALKKSVVYFKLEAEIQVRPLLVTLPIFNGYSGTEAASDTDWRTYKISAVRGYS
ncbi:MAG: Tad domain-containing protein [Ruminococcus sp.]|nr:Tad domain-containing protein [Ruminococcus sp.]